MVKTMDIQFELNGEIVEIAELAVRLNNPSVAQAVLNVAEQIVGEIHLECETHHEHPAITLVISETHGFGVRVSACCQRFVEQVQERVRAVYTRSLQLSTGVTAGLNLVIRVAGTSKSFVFDVTRIDVLVIGRIDPDTGLRPDIDLSTFGAYENGVSRRHASIVLMNRGLYLLDEGTPNGTFLNERRLKPREPDALKYGDRVRLGRLVLEITLDYPASTS
ncbi:MAG: FHA domain-containing protein [Anaerolineae bacterium]|nr:FHA domain-containing protein [Anaerolineae bacterium]